MGARKREKAWTDFAEWCKARGLRALPAHPWTLAAYARWCEARHRYPVIVKRIRAIARVHLLECAGAPDRHPTVTRTLRMLEARNRARGTRAALFPADEMAATSPLSASGVQRRARRERRRERTLRVAPHLVSRRPKGS
jgi:predicted membrane chloride channel (bestrophin family)